MMELSDLEAEAVSLFLCAFATEADASQTATPAADPAELIIASAPGRVNLIGEHTDYNAGFVLPAALGGEGMRTVCVARRVPPGQPCRVVSSVDPEDVRSFEPPERTPAPARGSAPWERYIEGVSHQYVPSQCSFVAAYASGVPQGGGLSSSAALEVATAAMLEEMLSPQAADSSSASQSQRTLLALRCVEAEHTFANVPCGIMDQMASALGRLDHAMFLDTRSLEIRYVPFSSSTVCILIVNSNVKHELSGSEYPDRVRQCHAAAATMHKASLRDATQDDLSKVAADPLLHRRARHVITENARTEAVVQAAARQDYAEVGRLMNESHASLRDDYEVSTPELDFLAAEAAALPGVFGARMTGGGFGGCIVALINKDAVANVSATLSQAYRDKFGVECTCFATAPGEGMRVRRHVVVDEDRERARARARAKRARPDG